jgi:hypothetical protein
MPRSLKSLAQYARTGTFRAERHAALLAREPLVTPEELHRIQTAYQQSGSEAERRELAREFEKAALAYAETVAGAPLGELVRDMAPHEFCAEYLTHTKGIAAGSRFVFEQFQRRAVDELYRRDADGRRLFKLGRTRPRSTASPATRIRPGSSTGTRRGSSRPTRAWRARSACRMTA